MDNALMAFKPEEIEVKMTIVDKPSEFSKLLTEAQILHDKKKHDYTGTDPYGNYRFAGLIGSLFKNPNDIGFVTRIAEKLYRLAMLQDKEPLNESVEDTELDLAVIINLWVASRRERRGSNRESRG